MMPPLHHGFALLLDVDGGVIAGELAEILCRGVEILLHRLETFFQEDAFAMRRRGVQFHHQPVEFIDVRFGDRLALARGLWSVTARFQ